jgi:Bacterial TSP3 repeat
MQLRPNRSVIRPMSPVSIMPLGISGARSTRGGAGGTRSPNFPVACAISKVSSKRFDDTGNPGPISNVVVVDGPDEDEDGFSDALESVIGTNPLDPCSDTVYSEINHGL